MKKFKVWLSTLCLALTLAFVNLQPVIVYAGDGDGPQDTGQKKSTPSQTLSPQMIIFILMAMRMI
jgi:hypothetical protein